MVAVTKFGTTKLGIDYRSLVNDKREPFWRPLNNPVPLQFSAWRAPWSTINNLLGRGRPPPCDDIDPEVFHQFFDKKVAAVHDLLADASPLHFPTPVAAASLSDFQAVTIDDITSAIRRPPN